MKPVIDFFKKYVFFQLMALLAAFSGTILTLGMILGNQRGTVPVVAGTPDHTVTGDAYIPWIFSRLTVEKFYDVSVAPQVSSTQYQGIF